MAGLTVTAREQRFFATGIDPDGHRFDIEPLIRLKRDAIAAARAALEQGTEHWGGRTYVVHQVEIGDRWARRGQVMTWRLVKADGPLIPTEYRGARPVQAPV